VDEFEDKLECLVVMCRKLFWLVEGKCKPESVDSVMMQEAVLSGHLYLQARCSKPPNHSSNLEFTGAAGQIGKVVDAASLGHHQKSCCQRTSLCPHPRSSPFLLLYLIPLA